MRVTVLAAGSRGDIQPYLALALGLKHAGHVVRFAANLNFESLAAAYGLEFFPLQVDSFALTREPETQDWLASRSLPELIWRSRRVVGPITGRFLADAWQACQGADAMIYHTYTLPTAFVIGQRLGIPCLPASLNPLPTRAHPSLPLELKASLGSPLNLLTHLVEQQITWGVYRGSARAFFGDGRGIPIRAPYFLWREERRPVVCCYSRHVLPVPPDLPDHIHITGYWFLETPENWQPDSALLQFLEKGPAPVYIGFGSIGNPARTHETTQIVLDALAQSGQRGLLEPGWSGLGRGTALSDSVFVLDSAPHRWLFPRMAAIVHHGGVGTTAAALRAGVPTLAVPHFTDTHFWGRRVAALGAGPEPIPRRQLTAERLASAIAEAAENPHVRQRAAEIGELIRVEDGIGRAVDIFHRYVENCQRATSQSSPSTASGALELIGDVLSLRDQVLPPTINYTTPDPECDLDYVTEGRRPHPTRTIMPPKRLTRLAPLALFFVALTFYIYTLQPSLSWGDGIRLQHEAITGESFILAELVRAQFAPDPFPFARLGVAAWDHPLYVIIGHTLVRLLPAVDPLWLVNLLSAIFGAAALAVLYQLCYANTRSVAVSLLASLSLAVSHTYWFHAVTPEVYSLHVFLLLLSIYLYDNYERTGRRHRLALAAFALGLAAANHLLAFLALPAFAIYASWSQRRDAPLGRLYQSIAAESRSYVASVLAFLLGFLPYLIQFARMLRTFPLTRVMGPAVGDTFLRGLLTTTPGLFAQSVFSFLMFLTLQFTPIGLLIGLVGVWTGARMRPALWKKPLTLFAVYAAFGILYRVSDQFAFFLSAYVFWAIFVCIGLSHLLSTLPSAGRRALTVGASLIVIGMPFFYQALPAWARAAGLTDEALGIPQIGTGYRDGLAFYINPNRRGDDAAYRFGKETLAALPPDSIIIAEWYADTDEYFVFRYFSEIEGIRPDVEIAGWPLEDIATFDSSISLAKIVAELPRRPVYLASLNEQFYAASTLAREYCIVPENNLYRVYPREQRGRTGCLVFVDNLFGVKRMGTDNKNIR